MITNKAINRRRILNTIRSNKSISRAEIAKELNVSRSTVSSIVDELILEELVNEGGKNKSNEKGGRRGIQLSFNPEAKYGIGVDIGGTKVLYSLTNLDGEVIHSMRYDTPSTVELFIDQIRDFINTMHVSLEDIETMGLSIAGMVDSSEGVIVHSPNLDWHNVPIRTMLSEIYPFPVYANNDVNCAIFGEWLKGKGKDSQNFVFIAIGTGIGSAIIANGQLIEGHSFTAGEIGYFADRKDNLDEYEVSLEKFGPLENRLSGNGLNQIYGDSYQLFRDYHKEVPKAVEIMNAYVRDIAIAISNVVSLLNPEKVIIGGGVSEALEPLLPKIEEQIVKITPNRVQLELSSLGIEASSIGAAAYAFHKLETL